MSARDHRRDFTVSKDKVAGAELFEGVIVDRLK
jgi:hypothetical protein